jgi:hypothetical protein
MANLDSSRLNFSRFGANVGFANESVEDYLVRMLGPKHLPLAVVLPITIIYVSIFASGVVGNVAVCVVIARNKSMRTATNYYLFSLAVSDLTLLLLGKCADHLNATTASLLHYVLFFFFFWYSFLLEADPRASATGRIR